MTLKIGSAPRDFHSQDSLARWLYRNKLCKNLREYYFIYIFFNLYALTVHCYPIQACSEKQVFYGASRGIIVSPGYPKTYSNHLSCAWTIKNIKNNVVTISFEDIDIEEDLDCLNAPCCKHNWLKISSFHNKSVHVFCGHNMQPYPIFTTDEIIWIKFHIRNLRNGGRGFKIKYTISSTFSTKPPECKQSDYRCENGQCVPRTSVCNGFFDCQDASDEDNCLLPDITSPMTACRSNEYRCDNGQCILRTLVCNDFFDCQDKSDESYCVTESRCPQNMTWCGDSSFSCYMDSQKCDGIFHCPNGNDEIGCVPGCKSKIKCNSGNSCYDWRDRCNGISECNDYSDEKNCDSKKCRSENGAFLCNNLRCIRENWICDQTNDCGDNSDEQNCIKNSVITAAVIGSLICGLLLVIAIGCTCKLYALRVQDHRNSNCSSILSQLEREGMHLEPPPSYTLAINDPSAHYFQQAHFGIIESQCYSSRHRAGRRIRRLRRHRRRPPTPPPQVLPAVHESNNGESNDSLSPNSSASSTEFSPLFSVSADTNVLPEVNNPSFPVTSFEASNLSTLPFIPEIRSKTENKMTTNTNNSIALLNPSINLVSENISEEQTIVEPSVSCIVNSPSHSSPAFNTIVCASCHSSNSFSYPTETTDSIASASSDSNDSLTSLILQEGNDDQIPLLLPKCDSSS